MYWKFAKNFQKLPIKCQFRIGSLLEICHKFPTKCQLRIGSLLEICHKLPIKCQLRIGSLLEFCHKLPINDWKFIGKLPQTSNYNWKFIGNLPQTSHVQLEVYWKFTTNFQLQIGSLLEVFHKLPIKSGKSAGRHRMCAETYIILNWKFWANF